MPLNSHWAALRKHLLSRPLTYVHESAPRSNNRLKRRWPSLYYHATLKSMKALVEHYRTDAFVVSFPKSGRTWLRMMLGRAIAEHFELKDCDYTNLIDLSKREEAIPRMNFIHEDDPFWKSKDQLSRKKTEFRTKPVVLLVRDPRDIIVSAFHHKRSRDGVFDGGIDEFLDQPIGSIETIAEYFRIWNENANEPEKFLLIRYEDLHAKPETVLRSVLDFVDLGAISDERVEEAVQFSTFENMRKYESDGKFRLKGHLEGTENARKVRRGKIGNYREELTKDQVARLDRLVGELPERFGYEL